MSLHDIEMNTEDVCREFHMNLKFGDSEWRAVKYIFEMLTDNENAFTSDAIDWLEARVEECSHYMRTDDSVKAEELLGQIESAIDSRRAGRSPASVSEEVG